MNLDNEFSRHIFPTFIAEFSYFLDYDLLKVIRLINKKYKSLVTIEALCVSYVFRETGTNLYKIFIKRMTEENVIKTLEKRVKHYVVSYAQSYKCMYLPIPDVMFSDNILKCMIINKSCYEGGLVKLKKADEDFNTNRSSYNYTIPKADVIQYILFTSKPEYVYFIANGMIIDTCTIFDEVFLQLKKVEVDFEKGCYSLEAIEPLTKFYVYKIAEAPIPIRLSVYTVFGIKTNINLEHIYATSYVCNADVYNEIYNYKIHHVIMSNGNLIRCARGNIFNVNFY